MNDEGVPTRRGAARPALLVAGFGLLWVALHASGLLGAWTDVTFVLLGIGAVVGGIAGVRRWDPQPRWPWVLLISALVLFLIGGLLRSHLGTLGDLSDGRSPLPDLITLPGYAVLASGLFGLVRERSRGRTRDLDVVLDATLAALAALALAWVYLVSPALSQTEAPLDVRLLLVWYPAMSVFLVAMGFRVAFSPGITDALAFRLILVALVAVLMGDVVYMFVDTRLVGLPVEVIDVPYALAYVAFTTAVLHPSMRRVTERSPVANAEPHGGRLVFVAVALAVPAVVTLTQSEADGGERLVLSVIVLALTATAVWRMFRALRQHARSEARLAHRAAHDPLTELPNRVFLRDHLEHLLEGGGPEGLVAVSLLDIDRFKLVNDSLGHGIGDELLVSVARRLSSTLRPGDVVGRVGGDEFVVISAGIAERGMALEVAERTRLVLTTPFRVHASEIPVSASVGVSLRDPSSGPIDAESMFREADTAMYRAKDGGGSSVMLFDDSMRLAVAERLAFERELRHALERGQLRLVFQPIVRVGDCRVVGLEALLRWDHPTLGSVPPDVFIPIAEDTGLIVEIGAWVIEEATSALRSLRDGPTRARGLSVAVNISVRQLGDSRLLDDVARALVRNRLPASALCLELTESVLMENLPVTSKLLARVREFGVRLSVDDFGTGYSSLAYLRQLPVDEVKIDRAFVQGLDAEGADASLVEAIVALAASLGVETVAEGVESTRQAERLATLGCAQAQGYWYSRPVPLDGVPEVLGRLGLASEPRIRIVPTTA